MEVDLVGKISIRLGDDGLVFGDVSLPVMTNPHNFYIAGGWVYYSLPVPDGEKPPRAIAGYKDYILSLFQAEGNAILSLLKKETQERLNRYLRKDELGLFLEWVKSHVKGVGVDEMVFVRTQEGVYSSGMSLSFSSARRLFLALEHYLKERKNSMTVNIPEGKVVIEKRSVLFFEKKDNKLSPAGRIRNTDDNILRLMSIL